MNETTWYRTGTVTVTAGSKVVSGTGSTWLKQILAGDLFHLADANGVITTLPAEVAQISSDTELVLKAPWSGTTGSSQYAIVRNFTGSLPSDMAARLSTCLATQQLAIDQWLKFLTTNGPVTITALNGDSIQTTGLLTFGDTVSAVTTLQTAVDTKAPLASPALTGTPTAPTAAAGTATTQIASTAFVQTGLDTKQSISGKDASGGYAGLTLFKINFKNALGAITSFFTNANTAARTYTFQDRDGTIADHNDLALKAPQASPAFTGVPTAPTAAQFDSSTKLASTAFVQRALGNYQKLLAYTSSASIPADGIGAFITYYGSNAAQTLTLPRVSSIEGNFHGGCLTIRNLASVSITIATYAGDSILDQSNTSVTSLVLLPGESVVLADQGSTIVWDVVGSTCGITASQFDSSHRLATTEFVQRALGNFVGQVLVTTSRSLLASETGNIINTAGTITITLPLSSGVRVGGTFQINNVAGGVITVVASTGDNIYGIGIGSPRFFVLGYGDSITIANVGGVWYAWGGVQLGACAAFTSQQGSNGYYRHPGGAIHQYGTSSAIAAGETRTITFPTAFPAGVKAPLIWGDAGGNFRIVSISNGSMQVINVASFSSNLYYQIDGY